MKIEKKLPHSCESEMMVLGCAITTERDLNIVCEELQKEDFYIKEHQIIFDAIKGMQLKKSAVDIMLLCEQFKKQQILPQVGGVGYIVSLAQFSGTSAYIEDYVEEVKQLSALRKIAFHAKNVEDRALDGKETPTVLLEDLAKSLQSFEVRCRKKPLFISTQDRLAREEVFLTEQKGKKYLGLKTRFVEEFNECFLGLRGLNLLAAAPNTGKTALAVQIGLDVLLTERDVCLVYVSLEMSAEEIFRRMILSLAEVDYRSFVFGLDEESCHEKITKAKQVLSALNERMQILEIGATSLLDAKIIISYVESLKIRTGCERVLVVIDYLQVWPMSSKVKCFNENEMDKWRIGEMKKLKDALSPDPVLVISEARKPSMKDSSWGGDLSDVMGSARMTYTPDVVMLLSALKPKSLQALWEDHHLPFLKEDIVESDEGESDKKGLRIRRFLENQGIALCKLEVPKARDGMKKFSVILEFHYQKNTFKKPNFVEIRKKIAAFDMVHIKEKPLKRSFAEIFLERQS
jgi:replicative DNA helicase